MNQLDKQLVKDCHQLAEIDGVAVLLHKNAIVPWFILVPVSQTQFFRELFELPTWQRNQLQRAADALSTYLIQSHNSEKINIAALGNLVEQLHLHVIGRRKGDDCWPNPVWGNLHQVKEYSEDSLVRIHTDVSRLLQNA